MHGSLMTPRHHSMRPLKIDCAKSGELVIKSVTCLVPTQALARLGFKALNRLVVNHPVTNQHLKNDDSTAESFRRNFTSHLSHAGKP